MGFISTKIDEMIDLLEASKLLHLDKIAEKLHWNAEHLERVARALERVGVVRLSYPISLDQKPEISLSKPHSLAVPIVPMPHGKSLAAYSIVVEQDQLSVDVEVIFSESEKQPVYYADLPYFSPYVLLFLQSIKDDAAKFLPPEPLLMGEAEKAELFKTRQSFIFTKISDSFDPEEKLRGILVNYVMRDMFGIGDVEILMHDDNIEEIAVNRAELPLYIYHRKFGWLSTNLVLGSEDQAYNLASLIGRKVGKQLSSLSPLLDAHLPTGDRVNATIYPISSLGNSITIRKFARNPITMLDYASSFGNLSFEMAAFLWQAVQYEMNVLVCGGTASGKTTMLNALLAFIPPMQRVISIEDTRELMLPSTQKNWVAMRTRPKNPEGIGEVSMLDLLVNSLRMRPDRIVMGEVRKKEEAEVLFEAMHTGHSAYGTVHADTAAQLVDRLVEPPFSLPGEQVASLNLVVVQYRSRRSGLRRTMSISEVVSGSLKPEINHVYLHRPRKDSFDFVNKPEKYLSLMNLHTGMTEKEILSDQKDKSIVLQWMVKQKCTTIEKVGSVMKAYFLDTAGIVSKASKNEDPAKVL